MLSLLRITVKVVDDANGDDVDSIWLEVLFIGIAGKHSSSISVNNDFRINLFHNFSMTFDFEHKIVRDMQRMPCKNTLKTTCFC